MTRIEAQHAKFLSIFSRGSEQEPVANFLGNVSYGATAAAGLLALSQTDLKKLPQEPRNHQELAATLFNPDLLSNIAIYAGPVAAVLVANMFIYKAYLQRAPAEQALIRERLKRIGQNPLNIFRK